MLLLFPPALIQAPPPGPPPGHHPEMPLLRCAQELGLSEDQMSKIHDLLRAHRDVMEQKGLAFHQAHRAVHEALRDPGASQSQMDALVQAAAAKEGEFMRELYATHSACWDVLTPSQRSKAKSLMARLPEGGGPGDGPRFGGPGGERGPGGQRGPGGERGPGGARRPGGEHSPGFGGPGEDGMPPGPPPGGPEDGGF